MEHEDLKAQGVEIFYSSFPNFPPPPLFIKGQRKLLTSEGAAIVGARNVSDTGISIARKLAGQLASVGLNIVSGYAKGVDSEAHLGALAAGGTTTMVLSCGIKKLYQKRAFKAFDWRHQVLVVSQFDPDARWSARNAMARNKLVCALSKAVVVIESGPERDSQGKMSGTFNTAQTAMRMGLPLFVLDPSCFDNPPQGNVDLIKLGGKCLDPASGAEVVVKYMKPNPVKKQEASGQLIFLDISEIQKRGRWSGNKSAGDVVWEAVREFTGGDKTIEFSINEVYGHILKKYPEFKKGTVSTRLLMDCPNHPSYNKYSRKYKYYHWVRTGIYRLFSP